jgi:hypothetical protein
VDHSKVLERRFDIAVESIADESRPKPLDQIAPPSNAEELPCFRCLPIGIQPRSALGGVAVAPE